MFWLKADMERAYINIEKNEDNNQTFEKCFDIYSYFY